ncbi:hypothetical protein MASR1M97_07970 [Candidatus Desulfobacillus denitrificans]
MPTVVASGRTFAGADRFDGFPGDFTTLEGAGLLAGGAIGFAQLGLGQLGHLGGEGLVLGRRLPVPLRFAGDLDQFVDGVDGGLHLLMAEHHGAEHDVLGQLLRLGLDHQHGGSGAGDDQVEPAVLELRDRRAQHVLAIDVADAGGADRPVEGNAGEGQRGGDADHGRDVGVDLGVARQHGGDHLHVVVEAVREERADRAIDQAGGEYLLLGRTALALEEAAGNAAGGIHLLHVIDGQREEILAGLRLLGGDDGGENDGLVHVDQDGAVGLARDFAGLQRDSVCAVGKAFLGSGKQGTILSISRGRTQSPRIRQSRRSLQGGAGILGHALGSMGHARTSVTCAGRGARSARDSCRHSCA